MESYYQERVSMPECPDNAKMSFESDINKIANQIAEMLSADLILINAGIERGLDDQLIDLLSCRKRRKNVFLILVTPGGDADAAYRIARSLQDAYDKFIAFVPGYCKSAGTLCLLGAHELVMSEVGELGPLDVQLYKKDEIGELGSGLVAKEALQVLKEQAFKMFEDYFLAIEKKSAGQVTFKTATEISIKITVGLLEPLYKQIDPIQLGEMERYLRIASAYGKRLMLRSKNFREKTLELLTESYPSHGFVIDKSEAETLFKNVRSPSKEENMLRCLLEAINYNAIPNETIQFLSNEVKGESNENTTDAKPNKKTK